MSRVGAWATSFEKLVEDPAGVQTFAEFLKKEISEENIYFWTACQRYKMIDNPEERLETAKAIFNRYLAEGAPEAVNVYSHARQVADEGLKQQQADEFLFGPVGCILSFAPFLSWSLPPIRKLILSRKTAYSNIKM